MPEVKHDVIQINDSTWCIGEFKLVNAFLAVGEERAALIDTCCGIGNIAKIVQGLTDKPLEILLTHGHVDHIGGLYLFPHTPTYLHPADIHMTDLVACDNKFREFYIKSRSPVRNPGEGMIEGMMALVPQPDPGPISLKDTLPLADGQVIDLGNRPLKVIHTPGHSEGSVCFLDTKNRILFSGDTVNNSIILMRQPNNDTKLIRQYHETLEKLWKESDQYDCLAIGHDGVTIDKQFVKDYLDLTAGLLDGSITGQYEESGFRKGDVARHGLAELWYQCDA